MSTIPLAQLVVLLASLCIPLSLTAAEERAPGIVFLLADDLGWGDLSCHGSSFIRSPKTDGRARQGTDLLNRMAHCGMLS